ncbi:MAG: ATP synthase F1 subunit delta [Buchnera aphidicola (Periphyllus aceris)]|nr:ATP synthase F1 subunit delta [Buchnera aphidicola (Periphyllus aceris)]
MIFEKNLVNNYAKSVFYVAVNKNSINRWKKFLKILGYLSIQKKLKILCFRNFNSDKLYKILFFFLNELNMNDYEKNFLKIICQNNRFFLLFKIFKKYKKIYKKYKNVTDVILKISHNINSIQKNIIINSLEKIFMKKINLKIFKKKKLIGGFVISINGRVIDYSVKNYLKSLKYFIQT